MNQITRHIEDLERHIRLERVPAWMSDWAASHVEAARRRWRGLSDDEDAAYRDSSGEASWERNGGPAAVIAGELARLDVRRLAVLADGKTDMGPDGWITLADLRRLADRYPPAVVAADLADAAQR